jgi:hypothetical protein
VRSPGASRPDHEDRVGCLSGQPARSLARRAACPPSSRGRTRCSAAGPGRPRARPAGPRATAWPGGCACARSPRGCRARRRCPWPSCSPSSTARGSSATRAGSCAAPAAAAGSPAPARSASSASARGPPPTSRRVEALAVAPLAAVVLEQDVRATPNRYAWKVVPSRIRDCVSRQHQEGPLDQVRRLLARLAAEEPRQAVVIALEEDLARILVTVAPGRQELLFIRHGPDGSRNRGRGAAGLGPRSPATSSRPARVMQARRRRGPR